MDYKVGRTYISEIYHSAIQKIEGLIVRTYAPGDGLAYATIKQQPNYSGIAILANSRDSSPPSPTRVKLKESQKRKGVPHGQKGARKTLVRTGDGGWKTQ